MDPILVSAGCLFGADQVIRTHDSNGETVDLELDRARLALLVPPHSFDFPQEVEIAGIGSEREIESRFRSASVETERQVRRYAPEVGSERPKCQCQGLEIRTPIGHS
jgi:hypothetical protein